MPSLLYANYLGKIIQRPVYSVFTVRHVCIFYRPAVSLINGGVLTLSMLAFTLQLHGTYILAANLFIYIPDVRWLMDLTKQILMAICVSLPQTHTRCQCPHPVSSGPWLPCTYERDHRPASERSSGGTPHPPSPGNWTGSLSCLQIEFR